MAIFSDERYSEPKENASGTSDISWLKSGKRVSNAFTWRGPKLGIGIWTVMSKWMSVVDNWYDGVLKTSRYFAASIG